MKNTLETLWYEYFAEECAAIDTEEERALAKKAIDWSREANESLTKEQLEVVEKHVEALCELQEAFVKKAFYKGCRFASSFFLATAPFEKE